MQLQQLLESMIAYMGGDARRIQHFIKVHALAQLIGRQEQLNERMTKILSAHLKFICQTETMSFYAHIREEKHLIL